ncbi:MAG: ABC transporter ATP-binding protein [Actinomycetota bacterium]
MIRFNNVTLIYPYVQRTIFEDLSFEVPEGEFVLVMGDTGAGKSTLLKLMNGLVPHHTGGIFSGSIMVDGKDTALHKPRDLVDVIAIVGQNPALGFVTDTVEEELVFGMESLGVAPEVMRKRVEDMLDLLALTPLRQRKLSSLSGGEAQRVAIASVLTMNPKILLLDEPTSALDPIAAEEVLATLSRLVHDLGITVVIAEHKLERVLQFVDRVIYVRNEREVAVGFPQEILKDSTLAPPIVHLFRSLASEISDKEVPLTVRDARRQLGDLAAALSPLKRNQPTIAVEPLLELENVAIHYGAKVALKNVSLAISPGEIVAIMGRNGAGKSTLLSSIAGLRKLERGLVRVCGLDPQLLKGKDLIAKIGFVPQEASDLLYAQSVEEELRHSDHDNGVTSGTTSRLLARLLPDIDVHVHPRDLSEGERLCLVLAIVLANNPPLLILDEPTRGLDYRAKDRLITAIRECRDLKSAVIVASHDVELIAEIATRVVVLADGEIVADGPAGEILTSSPAFAPQVAKVLAPAQWLTVNEVLKSIGKSAP